LALKTRGAPSEGGTIKTHPENLLAIHWGMATVALSVGQLVLSRHGKSSSERGSVMI
jgi:hypothetical protein